MTAGESTAVSSAAGAVLKSTPAMKPVSVLFVCLGNICRSPMAEGVFQHLTKPKNDTHHPLIARIDSCGTGAYHVGDGPDSRTMSTLKDNGITTYKHKARKFHLSDFKTFDYIMAMDDENLDDLQRLRKSCIKKNNMEDHELGRVMLFGDFGGEEGEVVIDPYYGTRDGFDVAYEQMIRFSNGFLKTLEKQAAAAEKQSGGE